MSVPKATFDCLIMQTGVSKSGGRQRNAFPAVCFDESLKIFQKDIIAGSNGVSRYHTFATILRVAGSGKTGFKMAPSMTRKHRGNEFTVKVFHFGGALPSKDTLVS